LEAKKNANFNFLSKDSYGTKLFRCQFFIFRNHKKICSLAGKVYLVNKITKDLQGLLFIFVAEGEKKGEKETPRKIKMVKNQAKTFLDLQKIFES
jgi:hypothetical protein